MKVLFFDLETSEISIVDIDVADGKLRMLLAATLGGEPLETVETNDDNDMIYYGLDDLDDDYAEGELLDRPDEPDYTQYLY